MKIKIRSFILKFILKVSSLSNICGLLSLGCQVSVKMFVRSSCDLDASKSDKSLSSITSDYMETALLKFENVRFLMGFRLPSTLVR